MRCAGWFDSRTIVLLLVCVVVAIVIVPEALFAGPGGEIVEAVFKTTWGRIILLVLVIVLGPVIAYVMVREAIEVRRTRRDLAQLAERWPYFEWEVIEERVEQAVKLLYRLWNTGDISGAAGYLDPECLQSQQDILDRWRDEGKRNVCRLVKLKKVRPLWVSVEDEGSYSIVVVEIDMALIDYLEVVESGKRLKGKNEDRGSSAIWVMGYDGEEWRLLSIEADDESLVYATKKNRTSTGFLQQESLALTPRVPSKATAFETTTDFPATEDEEAVVEVAEDENEDRRPTEVDERSEHER